MRTTNAVLIVAWTLCSAAADASQTLRMSLASKCDQPNQILVSLTNEGNRSAEIATKLLPWSEGASSLEIQAFAVGQGRSAKMQTQGAIGDYLGTTKLGPQRRLTGVIELNRVLSKFDEFHRSNDILVLLAPARRSFDGWTFAGDQAVILIPKRGFFSSDCPTLISKPLPAK